MLQSSDSLPHIVSKFKTMIQVVHFRFFFLAFFIQFGIQKYAYYVFKPQNIAAVFLEK